MTMTMQTHLSPLVALIAGILILRSCTSIVRVIQ